MSGALAAHGASGRRAGRVVIVGAGIAGIAAAIRLSEHGVPVDLLETRKKLGGRATSFVDTRTGETLDNCQHVVLGCCTNYLDFLRRLNALHHVTWHGDQHWVEAGGRVSVLRSSWLPAPLHMSLSMLRAPMLSNRDRRCLARAVVRILRADRRGLDEGTFVSFLRDAGQPDGLIERFWSPIVVSACNLGVERVSARTAVQVFQEGLLAHRDAGRIGVPSVPLSRLYADAESIIVRAGGSVRLGVSVERMDAHSAHGRDRSYAADATICALPFDRVCRVMDAGVLSTDPRFAAFESFVPSPIVGVHLTFDRSVMTLPHAVLVSRPTQWLFRKDSAGCRVHAVISAADEWIGLDESAIVERVTADISACFPDAADAKVVAARAVKEKSATFAPLPGLDRSRPGTTGPSGVILAGDYTDTGWPATMESAARSGYRAAAAVLGLPLNSLIVASLKPSLMCRLLAR